MRTLRLIVYLLLTIDLCIFAGYRKLLHQSEWAWEQPLIVFLLINLSLVLLVVLYTFFTFQYSEPAKRKDIPLMVVTLLMAFFLWLNPLHWPLGSRVTLAGSWTGKPTNGKILFFEDGFFEIAWNGIARDGVYRGRYQTTGDTIVLNYWGKQLDRVGDTLLVEKGAIVPLNGYSDWIFRHVEFEIVAD